MILGTERIHSLHTHVPICSFPFSGFVQYAYANLVYASCIDIEETNVS